MPMEFKSKQQACRTVSSRLLHLVRTSRGGLLWCCPICHSSVNALHELHFSCRHTMYLGCILSNWFDFARAHRYPIYGIRPDGTFTCPMCRASINLDERTYSQLWRPRSSFPGPSNQTRLKATFPKMIFPGRIPEQNIISYQP